MLTLVLLGVNLLAYIGQGAPTQLDLSAHPYNQFTADYLLDGAAVADGQWYRLITASFLHASLLHLGLNMLALFTLGPALERYFGFSRFAVLYLLSAVGGNALAYLVDGRDTGVLGASTALYGLLAATFVVVRHLRADTSVVTANLVIAVIFTLSLRNVVSVWGHLGGLILGAVLAAVFTRIPARAALVQWVVVVAVVAGLVAAVAIRTAGLPSTAAGGSFPHVDRGCGYLAQRHWVATPSPTTMKPKPTSTFQFFRCSSPSIPPVT